VKRAVPSGLVRRWLIVNERGGFVGGWGCPQVGLRPATLKTAGRLNDSEPLDRNPCWHGDLPINIPVANCPRSPRCDRFRRPAAGRGGWAALAFSVATYAAVSIALHQPFHAGGLRLRYFDLRIYHLAALRLAHGSSLYATPMLHHLGFTYPPFAALLLAPLGWVPLSVDKLAVTGSTSCCSSGSCVALSC
jgi:hypothetical protein